MLNAQCSIQTYKGGTNLIKITISEGRIAATGHAGAGPRGRDLVCAGVSVLLSTLAEYLAEVRARELTVKLDPGDGEISASNHEEAFTLIAAGLRLLEECYPACIKIV